MKEVRKSKLLLRQFNEELQLNRLRYENESQLLTNKGYHQSQITRILSAGLPRITVWKLLACHDKLFTYGFTHDELTRIAQYRYGWKTLHTLIRHYGDLWIYGFKRHHVSLLVGHLYGWLSIEGVLQYFVNTPPRFHSLPEILLLTLIYGERGCVQALESSPSPVALTLLVPPIQKPSMLTVKLQQEVGRALDRYQAIKTELVAKGYGEDVFLNQKTDLVSLWCLLACHENFIAMGFKHNELALVAFHPQGWKTLSELQKRYHYFVERGFCRRDIVILAGHGKGLLSLQHVAVAISQKEGSLTRQQVHQLIDDFGPNKRSKLAKVTTHGTKRKGGERGDGLVVLESIQSAGPLFFRPRRHSLTDVPMAQLDFDGAQHLVSRPASTH